MFYVTLILHTFQSLIPPDSSSHRTWEGRGGHALSPQDPPRAFYLQRPEPIHLVKEMATAVVPVTNQGKDVSSGVEKQQIQTKYLQQKCFKRSVMSELSIAKEKRIQKNSFS